MGRRYRQIDDGEWFRPGKDHKNICCACGLAHKINLHIRDGHIEIQFVRDARATAAARRSFAFTPDKDTD
jgi:hypothetical protein